MLRCMVQREDRSPLRSTPRATVVLLLALCWLLCSVPGLAFEKKTVRLNGSNTAVLFEDGTMILQAAPLRGEGLESFTLARQALTASRRLLARQCDLASRQHHYYPGLGKRCGRRSSRRCGYHPARPAVELRHQRGHEFYQPLPKPHRRQTLHTGDLGSLLRPSTGRQTGQPSTPNSGAPTSTSPR